MVQCLIAIVAVGMTLMLVKRYNRVMDSHIWSIRVFSSDNFIQDAPMDDKLSRPTLQASDITDAAAELVADPFLYKHGSTIYLFFEVYNKVTEKGEIGLAASTDGENWTYEKIILAEKFHLSYPQVFAFEGEIYMLPESIAATKVQLYRATNFPYEWEIAHELLHSKYADPSIFRYQDMWWMLACTAGHLHLFYSQNLEGDWKEHKKSPLIKSDMSITRPGGRVIVDNNAIYRYTQQGEPYYGHSVNLFKITTLTEDDFAEERINTVLSGTNKENDWRKDGMHHIDQLKINDNKWLIAVDGHRFEKKHYFSWKMDRLASKIHRLLKA